MFLHALSFMSSASCSRLMSHLNLDLLEAVFPHGSEGSDTILTEVNQNMPARLRVSKSNLGSVSIATYIASPSMD